MEKMIHITRARHGWPEKSGFTIHRPQGLKTYTFLHFWNSVELLLDGQVITTPPGSCILFDVDTPQWFCSREPLKHDWIHFTGDVTALLQTLGLEMDKLYTPLNGRFISEIAREIELEVLTEPEHHQCLSELKFRELLVKLSRSCSKGAAGILKPAARKQLMDVRSLVFSQLDQPWTVAQMAALAYVSPSRFYNIYHTMFGISPTDDLIRARIDTAKNRLIHTNESVHAMAEALGYRNVTHFCRQFKQITGMTPSQFRQSQQNE